MTTTQPYRVKTITDYHRLLGLPNPQHPLVSVIDLSSFTSPPVDSPVSLVFDFYSVALKKDFHRKMKYGQQSFDFDEGVMFCMAPGQVFGIEPRGATVAGHDEGQGAAEDLPAGKCVTPSGWIVLVHPDFLWNTPLAKSIRQYEFFGYSANEALYLSDKEEGMVTGIARSMEQEYNSSIDKFSQPVIIAQLELMLTYTDRFYQRQFITRRISNHAILARLEELLSACFKSDALATGGLPTVAFIASSLNVSPNYLTSVLKNLTGMSTQQHLHVKLIELAKERLSTTNLTVSEIAYELGFEHLQSFSKLFKTKTHLSPLEFRQSFN